MWNWNSQWVMKSTTKCKSGLIIPMWNWNNLVYADIIAEINGLIIPMWNWNEVDFDSKFSSFIGLIIPMWNWNLYVIACPGNDFFMD